MPKLGYISASQFNDIDTKDRSGKGFGKTAWTYGETVAMGICGGVEKEEIYSPHLARGKENESEGIIYYERERFVTTDIVGFTAHPRYPYIGGTPDRLVLSERGGIDIKCPTNLNHFRNLNDSTQIEEHMNQLQMYMAIFDLDWYEMVSFNKNYPEALQLSITRIERDDVLINRLETLGERFWFEVVQVLVKKFKEKHPHFTLKQVA